MSDETPTPTVREGLGTGYPQVKGRCPWCGSQSLFVGKGGYVTCSWIECRRPDAASNLLEQSCAVLAAGVKAAEDFERSMQAIKEAIESPPDQVAWLRRTLLSFGPGGLQPEEENDG